MTCLTPTQGLAPSYVFAGQKQGEIEGPGIHLLQMNSKYADFWPLEILQRGLFPFEAAANGTCSGPERGVQGSWQPSL